MMISGYKHVLGAEEGAELAQLAERLGDERAVHCEHLVFSCFVLKDLQIGSLAFWRAVLDEMREAVASVPSAASDGSGPDAPSRTFRARGHLRLID